jgi:hypothetical protein
MLQMPRIGADDLRWSAPSALSAGKFSLNRSSVASALSSHYETLSYIVHCTTKAIRLHEWFDVLNRTADGHFLQHLSFHGFCIRVHLYLFFRRLCIIVHLCFAILSFIENEGTDYQEAQYHKY